MTERPQSRYEWFLFGLLLAGGAQIAVAVLLIIYDVLARNLGGAPFAHTVAVTEYALLFTAFLGAPWLVRTDGHVRVHLLATVLPPAARSPLLRATSALAMLVCLLLGWYSLQVAVEAFARGDVEVRSFDMPRFLIFAVMPPSFLLLAVEFAREALGRGGVRRAGPGASV